LNGVTFNTNDFSVESQMFAFGVDASVAALAGGGFLIPF
jgi:hypothetical protein